MSAVHVDGIKTATVETSGLKEIRLAIQHLRGNGGIVAIDGRPGVGKTFATRFVLSGLDLRVCWADMPDTTKGKEASARIFSAVTGKRPRIQMTEYQLTEETVDVLDGLRAVIVIDEAQNLNVNALRQIRYLHDRPTTRALLILIGSDVLTAIRRVPELDSRVARRVHVKELRGEQIGDVVTQLHPILEATTTVTLNELARYAKGNLRQWVRIIEVATNGNLDVDQGIQPKAAAHIIRVITGGTK
jgi:DNA transposition AAA+ family ATPase